MLAQSFFSPSPSPSLYIPQYFHGIARRILINKNSVAIINPIFSTVSFFFFHPPPPRLQFISFYLPGHRVSRNVLEYFPKCFSRRVILFHDNKISSSSLPFFFFLLYKRAASKQSIFYETERNLVNAWRVCVYFITRKWKNLGKWCIVRAAFGFKFLVWIGSDGWGRRGMFQDRGRIDR